MVEISLLEETSMVIIIYACFFKKSDIIIIGLEEIQHHVINFQLINNSYFLTAAF